MMSNLVYKILNGIEFYFILFILVVTNGAERESTASKGSFNYKGHLP